MNYEENRLRTFHRWPVNAPVVPELLARNGFYATGNFLETECHWCHKKISDWQYGDEVSDRHKLIDPLCIFIVNPMNTDNIPINNYNNHNSNTSQTMASDSSSGSQQQISTTGLVDLKNEMHRLATFKNWPNPNISPQSLAKAGFYYLNQSDQVKCAWCKGVIAKWEKQDNAFEEHQRFFPDCPRVQLGPLIEIASDGIRDLGIQQISPPKKPKYSSLDARLRTYANWPIGDIQKPEALAQAGLYYQEIDDQVRCFHCNIGLRSWQKEDDPWFEHAKWFPHCQFVKLVKGPNYIAQVQEVTRQSINSDCETISGNGCSNNATGMANGERNISIDDAMSTSPVLQALEMGLNSGCIRNATLRKLETTGRPYQTIEDLVKAVLNDQVDDDDEEESEGPEPRNSIIREVSRIINSIFGQAENNSNNDRINNGDVFESNLLSHQQFIQNQNSQEHSHLSTSSTTYTTFPDITSSTFVQPTTSSIPASTEPSVSNLTTQSSLPSTSKSPEFTKTTDELRSSSSPDRKLSLEEENRKLKDARLCKVCLDEEVGVVFLPCGHLVTCVQCAPGVYQCPLCRSAIKGFVRTYLS